MAENDAEYDTSPVGVALWAVGIHAALLAIDMIVLVRVVTVFGKMFADFGSSLPGATQLVLTLSQRAMDRPLVALYSCLAFLLLDGIVRLLLALHVPKSIGAVWTWTITAVLIFFGGGFLFAMYIPMFRIGEVVSGG